MQVVTKLPFQGFDIGLQLVESPAFRVGFFRRGFNAATLKACGTKLVGRDSCSNMDVLITGKTSLSSLLGVTCKRHVVDLDY